MLRLAAGWDIEYVTDAGEPISVEVKATTSPTFPCFEIADNELRAATKLGDRYHLHLVSNC
ncbi:protein NO VEIN domain-containing protein [Lysobacter niastensis]|uniref:protein NO VEIN domain-containing protein n=1 Tax=Lysobacter niastensis TaxID=380629 RepID=UPI00360AAA11